ncbi:MAG TPA: hypothetical protein VGL61_11100 [Kofleriaceae bacterium]|jgi:hypothetical protein
MTTIDSHLLSTVTGGRQQQQAPQQAQQAPAQDDGGDPSQGQGQPTGGGGGNFLSGIMGFLQSPQFGQILGGIEGLISQFSGHGQPQQQQQQ